MSYHPYRRSSGRSTSRCVYLGNLSSRIHIDDIKHFFRRFRRRFDIRLKNGFGFIVSIFLYYMLLHISSHQMETVPTKWGAITS